MSQKPEKKHKRKQKTKQTITRAVTHIRLIEANPGKLRALDQLVSVYLMLCQQYVRLFCTAVAPSKYATPVFETELSDRWHRVAIQQAAGIAKSWRTNRAKAYESLPGSSVRLGARAGSRGYSETQRTRMVRVEHPRAARSLYPG